MSQDKRITAWLLACGVLPVMTTAVLSPSLAGMHDAFKGEPQIEVLSKLVLTAPALAIALGGGAFGILLDRWGRRPLMVFSLFIFALFGTYGFWANDIYSLIATRFLFGFGVVGVMTTTATMLADSFSGPELRRMVGLQAGIMGVWGITAQTIAGFLAEGHWRLPFLLFACSLPMLVWMLKLKGGWRDIHHSGQEKSGTRDWRRAPIILGCLVLLSAAAMSIFSLVPVHGPLYFRHNLHVGPRGTAFLISSLTAASSVSSLSLAIWRRHLSSGLLVLIGFIAIGISCGILGFLPKFWLVWLGMLAMGAGIGLVIPCLHAWTAQLVKSSKRGKALGFLLSANYIGQFFCPFWSQYFLDQGGDTLLFLSCFGISAGIITILSIIHCFRWMPVDAIAEPVIQNIQHPISSHDDRSAS